MSKNKKSNTETNVVHHKALETFNPDCIVFERFCKVKIVFETLRLPALRESTVVTAQLIFLFKQCDYFGN